MTEPSHRGGRPHRVSTTVLPAELQALVARAVPRRGLSRAVREEIARELSAHLEDGVRGGQTSAALAQTFGDPDVAAVLIGRARRRLRHPALRAAQLTLRVAVALFAATYAFSAWRLHSVQPQITGAGAAFEFRAGQQVDGLRPASADLLRRVYSDDGAGDGRVSAPGLRHLQGLLGKSEPAMAARILEPLFFVAPASRADAERELARLMDAAERRVAAGMAPSPAVALQTELAARSRSLVWSLRHYPVAAIVLFLSRTSRARNADARSASRPEVAAWPPPAVFRRRRAT